MTRITYSIIRPNDWPWGLAIWLALGKGAFENAPIRPNGEYLGTNPVPVQQ